MEVKVFKLKEIKLLSEDVVDVKKCCMLVWIFILFSMNMM